MSAGVESGELDLLALDDEDEPDMAAPGPPSDEVGDVSHCGKGAEPEPERTVVWVEVATMVVMLMLCIDMADIMESIELKEDRLELNDERAAGFVVAPDAALVVTVTRMVERDSVDVTVNVCCPAPGGGVGGGRGGVNEITCVERTVRTVVRTVGDAEEPPAPPSDGGSAGSAGELLSHK